MQQLLLAFYYIFNTFNIYFYCCFAASVLRLEIFLYSGKNGLLDIKALLLLLDHKSLSETLDNSTRKALNKINVRYFMTLMIRRCKVSHLLHHYINYYTSMYMYASKKISIFYCFEAITYKYLFMSLFLFRKNVYQNLH